MRRCIFFFFIVGHRAEKAKRHFCMMKCEDRRLDWWGYYTLGMIDRFQWAGFN